MKHVLFVDDEPNVLTGLRRMLRPMRQQWDMAFVASGREALEVLERRPCDVIVSDMQMPSMDGLQLLSEVKRLYPNAIRIVLSGYSEMETLLESVRLAHQYLTKPCDSETLKTTIDRATALRDLLANDNLRNLISQIDSLPTLPKLHAELMKQLASPEGSIARVGQIIAKDVGMTAKILQIANSAFFGLRRHISSPSQAVTLLGMDVISGLALSTKVFSLFEQTKSGLNIEVMQWHSEQTGTLARQIALAEDQPRGTCDNALIAGMLHDVGRLVLASHKPQEYAKVLASARDEAVNNSWSEEERIFGCTHMEVGAYLLGIWGLSSPIVEAVAYHHRPSTAVGVEFTPLTTVHVANALVRAQENGGEETDPLDIEYLSRLGLADHVPAWQDLYLDLRQKGVVAR